MKESSPTRTPTAINLHSKSRLLAIEFSDGANFQLPCEYLRVFAKAKEVRTLEAPVTGKENVNITHIEPQGQYAIRLSFDDGHDTSIYSWDTLYELGIQQEKNWQAYQAKLKEIGYVSGEAPAADVSRKVTLLYFTYLVKVLKKDSEAVEIPNTVANVTDLIGWLRRRNSDQAHLFQEGSFQVTVNKQFSEPFTRLDNGDEIAFIPTSPNAPTKK